MAALQPPLHIPRAAPAAGDDEAGLSGELALDLGRIAYENHHRVVYQAWLKQTADERRSLLGDRYVFFSVCLGVAAQAVSLTVAELRGVVVLLRSLESTQLAITEEWLKGLEVVAKALIDHDFVAEARVIVTVALRTGGSRFPRIAQSLQVQAAYLDALAGNVDDAARLARYLVEHPYLMANRRELPSHYRKLMFILSAGNQLGAYREVIWKGAASADPGLRSEFIGQVARTYRGAFRAILASGVPLRYRLAFLCGEGIRQLCRLAGVSASGAGRALWLLHTGILHALGLPRLTYARLNPERKAGFRFGLRARFGHDIRRILVTRAMGGIGDILMMTPGLQALGIMRPQAQIDFALAKSFHPLLDGISGIRLLDINSDEIDVRAYDRWVNLTDCPAGKVEGRQAPDVRRNRIEIFAKAMGVAQRRLETTVGYRPFYRVRPDEEAFAHSFLAAQNPQGLPVVGVQPFAADSYRNWPYMEQLVEALAAEALVLVFHHQPFPGYSGANIVKVIRPLRESIALLARCDRLVVLDSSFLHLSAALDKPAVAIFGAISGRLRTKDYPNVRLVAPSKREFPCYPCWRHEHKPCHLTNGRESICFRSIGVGAVIEALGSLNGGRPGAPRRGLRELVFYGKD